MHMYLSFGNWRKRQSRFHADRGQQHVAFFVPPSGLHLFHQAGGRAEKRGRGVLPEGQRPVRDAPHLEGEAGRLLYGGGRPDPDRGPVKAGTDLCQDRPGKAKRRILEPGDFWWEFFEHVWIRIIPARRLVSWVYGKISGILARIFHRKEEFPPA